ncbi:hypothetical protein HDU98_005741, partial [Podochytrium sp. JEL0797]
MHLTSFQLTCLLPFTCGFVWYFITAGVFFVIDVTQSFGRFKIQDTKATPSLAIYAKVFQFVLFNSIAVDLPMSYLISFFLNANDPVPHVMRILCDVAVSAVLFELIFYYTHRALHYPPLYKLVHKKHHEFLAPM